MSITPAPSKEKPPTEKELDAFNEESEILYIKESELIKEAFGKDSDVEDIIVSKKILNGLYKKKVRKFGLLKDLRLIQILPEI